MPRTQVLTYRGIKYRNTGEKITVPKKTTTVEKEKIYREFIDSGRLVRVGSGVRSSRSNPHKGMRCAEWVPKESSILKPPKGSTEPNVEAPKRKKAPRKNLEARYKSMYGERKKDK
jgi:hypothetical protein